MMSRSRFQGTEVTIVTGAFFYTYRLVLRGQSVLQFFKLLFSLANHCSQACSAFDRILAKKNVPKV